MKIQTASNVRYRVSAFCLALSLVLTSTLGVVSPAYADAHLCNAQGSSSYSVCINAGYTAHGYENNNSNSYWKAYPGHNCTNYVGYMLTKNGNSGPGILMGLGSDWDESAKALKYRVDDTPAIGSIAQWNTGASGHVAYVESVGSNSITVSEDNAAPYNAFRWRTITKNGDWPDNFLHIKHQAASGTDTIGVRRGTMFYLNNGFDGKGEITAEYGRATDEVVIGDWDGNGTDTIGVRRGTMFYLNNGFDGKGEITAEYGRATDEVVIGDWDGNGTDTIGVRRGTMFYLNNGFDGKGEITAEYGRATDEVVIGDWDGNGTDTIGVRRGTMFYLNNGFDGKGEITAEYGRATDEVVIGDWDGNGTDTIGVRRGTMFYLNNGFDGKGEITAEYGRATDEVVIGDWDGK